LMTMNCTIFDNHNRDNTYHLSMSMNCLNHVAWVWTSVNWHWEIVWQMNMSIPSDGASRASMFGPHAWIWVSYNWNT
jgi:hypothetical protein